MKSLAKSAAGQSVIRFLVGVLLIALFAGSIAVFTARVSHASGEIHELYRGSRAQAMGNAFTAVADDEEAIFYNPAGLAGIKKLKVNVVSEDIDFSGDSASKLATSVSAFKDFTADKLNTLMGNDLYLRSQFSPSIVLPGFGMAVLVDDQFALNLRNQALPSTLLGYQMTNGVQAATGFSVMPAGRRANSDLRVGIAGKMMWRRGGYRVLSLGEVMSLNKDALSQFAGSYERGMGLDLGVQYLRQFSDRLSLSGGVDYQNIGDVTFGPQGDPLKSNLNLGVAGTFDAKLFKTTLSLDERHLLDDVEWRKKLHFGAEFALPIVSLYGGLSEMHLTYGAAVDLWIIRVTALSYAEDLATYVGQQTSRRYMARIQVKFGF